MSMLAEPRRKQRVFNLRAKNNAWSNDTDKFGQKMLERMGWSTGKGLGAKEDGIVEHVSARYKSDSAGLGFVDKNDQWTKNEQDFEGLLQSLSGASDMNNGESRQMVSLEEKSKRSRARIHYHKSTRGKDLSKYSEKDLANIFGKKTLTEKPKKIKEITPVQEESTITGQLFTTKGTLVDYFKQIKNKDVVINPNFEGDLKKSDVFNGNLEFGFRGFSQTDFVNSTNQRSSEINQSNNDFAKITKKKKKKNKSINEEKHSASTDLVDHASDDVLQINIKGKKRTKIIQSDDHRALQISNDNNKSMNRKNSSDIEPDFCLKKHISKKTKHNITTKCNGDEYSIDIEEDIGALHKQNKKGKLKKTNLDFIHSRNNESVDEEINIKKKRKRSIDNSLDKECSMPDFCDNSKKAKKRKHKSLNDGFSINNGCDSISETVEQNNYKTIQKKIKHKQLHLNDANNSNDNIVSSEVRVENRKKRKHGKRDAL